MLGFVVDGMSPFRLRQNSNRGDDGGNELAAQPPPPPPAPRRRGRPPKQRPNPTFGNSLHVTVHADQGRRKTTTTEG
jgi:hypothetical protein